MAQSSSSSGIFFQGDGQSQDAGNSHLSSNFGNSSNSLPGHARGNLDPMSRDVSNMILNSVANSGPSVGASSLVTDANSGLSGGPHLQRSASVNTESYMRLPASPMSFSSNNISISGSSIMDGSSVVQQNSNQDPGSQVQQSQLHQGGSSATSLPRMGQVQLPGAPNSYVQDRTVISQLRKKPRLDIKQEDVQQQVIQQLLQKQDPMFLQNLNPQLQAMIQQQRQRQQEQQMMHAMPPMQRAHLLQQQQQLQQLQLRHQLQVQGMPPTSAVKRPYDNGVCSRRLNQYLYHQRQRPVVSNENSMAYWRKFVAEYYSPRAKKRWCLSQYNNVRQHSLGVFPQAATDAWQCDVCGSKSGRGFEATFEVLPRLNEIKFGSGLIDELQFLDLPRECVLPSGMMLLEYEKAVEESVYEQLRVVREGRLRIFFTPELKILSWEFCARRHEELLPRRLVVPQVNQLLQAAQKCQTTISESGANGVSQQDLQSNSAMVVTAGRQLARSLELQFLNDFGFSKRFVRCLQIADVVNSVKDLMDFCKEQKKGPVEGLKTFLQGQKMQETDRFEGVQGLPTDRNTLNKLVALQQHPGQMSNGSQHTGSRGALALMNFQTMLMRQNSMNSRDAATSSIPGTLQNSAFSIRRLPQQQQQQQLQPQTFQQLLQDMSKKNSGSISVSSLGLRNGPAVMTGSSSFKSSSSNSESPAAGKVGVDQKVLDLPQALNLPDEMVPDIVREFTENGFFDDDLDENMNFSWKP